MSDKKYFVIDFDSTFTKVEALDVLCEIAYEGNPEKNAIAAKVKQLTDLAMEGKMSFGEALAARVQLLKATKKHLAILIERLKNEVSDSIKRNKDFFLKNADDVLIISNGFKDFINPVVTEYGIKPENIYANTFVFDEAGNIIGYDHENPLAHPKGKVKLMKELNLKGEVFVIGDGYTDYQIKEAGLATKFFAFTENITRTNVIEKADHVAPSFDEVLYINKMPLAVSFPKNRIKVLLLEGIHPKAKTILEKEGYPVELLKGALDEDELIERIKDVRILGIRSKTQVTRRVIENANRLMAIGAFCIGTNQIDLQACSERGVAVFNAPYSNTRSVVELAIGEIIMLMRNLPDKMANMHKGKWEKVATHSYEVRNKKIGIIGYGNIGSQLSVLAEAMGMKVLYYDIVEKLAIGNAKKCSTLKELLNEADIISLHIDGRPENKNFIGEKEFAEMKDGVIFLNLARGNVVDIKALANAIRSGKVRGAGIDTFPYEPKNNDEEFVTELRNLPNVILTPHIGGSTQEAQENIAEFVPNKLIEYVNTGNTFLSVNFPNVQLPSLEKAHRLLHIHRNVPGILAKINSIMSKHNINIIGQYLKTNETIGYVITDIATEYNSEVINDLKAIENTIKFRVLY
ncbi:MAG: phosphoglycerate dehydrogenase [Flammeovirgaceae bacterium]|nr:phosphoglycerate dehydrogenase [Flammeovirgaceae bacterium]